MGVVAELPRQQRGQVFGYPRCAAVLNEGMAVPGRGR